MSPWSIGPSASSLSPGYLIRLIGYATDKLVALQISCGPQSRLVRARVVLEAFQRDPKRSRHDAVVLGEAVRTAIEFHLIARTVGGVKPPVHPLLRTALERALTGSLDPRKESNPIARNTQFELSVGAYLLAGGISFAIGEPDLIAHIGDEAVGVAAKRVTSRRKIIHRAKAAVAQIEKTGIRGIVALNLDAFVGEVSHGVAAEAAGESFTAALPEIELLHEILRGNPAVRGLILRGTKVSIAQHDSERAAKPPASVELTTYDTFHLYAEDPNDAIATDAILKDFESVQRERLGAVMRSA